ncbi:hypothetical protein TCAL_11731 [Tigriopus californicus]|uniref:Cyclic nucleotide-binding domain-containing protein n=1 Tax=Tigriopus californicus TaxID=6832 RepID=A0A553PPL2_TIGCA|nr:hypothetical protein TCAL_11731 [Tigriopus californicus]
MIVLLGIQSFCVLYNAWVIPLRVTFHVYQHADNIYLWMIFDYITDCLSLLDTFLFKTRLMFLDKDGIYCTNSQGMIKNYVTAGRFWQDILSLAPLDFLYLVFGLHGRATLLRLPRLLRYYCVETFFDRLDAVLPYPTVIRLSRTVNVMLYLIHITACAFYAFSDMEGIDSSPFVFNGHGNAYIRCFYVALKTSVSIGINPKPGRDRPATRNIDEYTFKFDLISQYMYAMHVPNDTMRRVKEWCQYTWKTQRSFDELSILEALPFKMRVDVTLDVHYKTLKNVKLFHGCDPGLLKELVVKLQPLIFLPGDYICKKGDVGKEMFIITVGQVQVVGGPDDSIVFVTLGVGVCFGEIALLGTGKMNRRTANVRAVGYTTLYVLYKEDLTEALTEFPKDRELLARKAEKAAAEVKVKQETRLPQSEKLQRDVVIPAPGDPSMLKVVVKTMPEKIKAKFQERETKAKTKVRSAQVDESQTVMANCERITVLASELINRR